MDQLLHETSYPVRIPPSLQLQLPLGNENIVVSHQSNRQSSSASPVSSQIAVSIPEKKSTPMSTRILVRKLQHIDLCNASFSKAHKDT